MPHAVASGHRLTTQAAQDVLHAGGTATDAVFAAACLAFVAEPVLAQPLGGGFLMLAPAHAPPRLLDAFVQTPRRKPPENALDLATVTVDFGTATQDFHIGAGTIAAPSLIQGLFQAHADQGRLPVADLVAPAVAAAKAGIAVTRFQSHLAGLVAPILTADPQLAALHAPGGKIPEPGAALANPALADVLEVLAAEGPRFFAEGEVAQALALLPGVGLSLADIASAAPIWRRPLTIDRTGNRIALTPPPSHGGTLIALALDALPPAPSPPTLAATLQAIARLRAGGALPPQRAITPALHAALDRALRHPPARRGTTHISVIDAAGNGAALTLSNGEGCGRLLPGTGIVPNNMLGEEDLLPGGALSWPTDTRLSSMMSPMAIGGPDGTLTLLGSGGSTRIWTALTRAALEIVDHRAAPDAAIAAPRLHADAEALHFERGPAAWDDALSPLEHATPWDTPHMFFGGVHIVQRHRDGGTRAAADPRRDGAAWSD
ncbi:MAG: gamma-glutamyltransferase [Pseudomonadota bacterium]